MTNKPATTSTKPKRPSKSKRTHTRRLKQAGVKN
jgi:hypothetical protein